MRRKISKILLAAVTGLLITGIALAHSPLQSSYPAKGETFNTTPDYIRLVFKDKVKLIEIVLEGAAPDLKLRPEKPRASPEHQLPLPPLSAGAYLAQWRALGEDGHIMKGQITFSVNSD